MPELEKYIRCHVVKATPMTRGEYNNYRGWRMPSNENPADEGYLVVYPDAYESWCPKAQFEAASRRTDGMSFGMAIEAMKQGQKVAREGWNGRGMYIWLMPGSDVVNCTNITDPHLQEISDENGGVISFLGSLRMKTALGKVLTGWLASQTDILSDDWYIVD